MKYRRFEDLPVWQAAIELAVRTYEMTDDPAFKGRSSLADQLERAVVSLSNNIAEGFERGTTNELLSFLYIARGSVAEVRSMVHLLRRLAGFLSLESRLSSLESLSESISRQLGAWINAIKDSEYQGHRHSNSSTRRASESERRRSAFLQELERYRQPPSWVASDSEVDSKEST